MKRKEYSAAAVKHPFWFMEFRNEVKLLSEGKSFEEIRELCKTENIFACKWRQGTDKLKRNINQNRRGSWQAG